MWKTSCRQNVSNRSDMLTVQSASEMPHLTPSLSQNRDEEDAKEFVDHEPPEITSPTERSIFVQVEESIRNPLLEKNEKGRQSLLNTRRRRKLHLQPISNPDISLLKLCRQI